MSNQHIPALRLLDGGLLEGATIGAVDPKTWADRAGNVLTDSGRTDEVMGWGKMDGQVRILVNDFGDDCYYIK